MKLIKLLKVDSKSVCPFQQSGSLDSRIRRRLQNPAKFLRPYIHNGMRVLDLGCGTGFCTFNIAQLLNGDGLVVAADLQTEMLDTVKQKAQSLGNSDIITFHKCESNSINWSGDKFDFILLFYMFHEMPNQAKTLQELKLLLNTNGKILIVEPLFHVNRKLFGNEKRIVQENGFSIISKPKIFFSRSMLISIEQKL